jgi:hypothetical protein
MHAATRQNTEQFIEWFRSAPPQTQTMMMDSAKTLGYCGKSDNRVWRSYFQHGGQRYHHLMEEGSECWRVSIRSQRGEYFVALADDPHRAQLEALNQMHSIA